MPNIRHLALITLLLWPPLTLAGEQTDSQNIKQDTQNLAQDLQSYSASQRDQAMADIHHTLKLFDSRIDQLSSEMSKNWDSMSDQARQQAKKNLAQLRAQRAKVKGWMDRLQNSSAQSWDDIKQGFSGALDSLSQAWENTRKSLQQDHDNDSKGAKSSGI